MMVDMGIQEQLKKTELGLPCHSERGRAERFSFCACGLKGPVSYASSLPMSAGSELHSRFASPEMPKPA